MTVSQVWSVAHTRGCFGTYCAIASDPATAMSTALLEHGVFIGEKGNYHASVIALLLQISVHGLMGARWVQRWGDVFSASMVNI